MRSAPCTGNSRQTLVTPCAWFHFDRIRHHSAAVGELMPSSEKYGLSVRAPCFWQYAAISTIASGGGKYQRQQIVRYFRVAALATPHASFERYIGRPLRNHSARTHSLIGRRTPFALGSVARRVYRTATSVTTGTPR